MWWDEISQLVQFKGIREPSASLIELNDDADFLESSMRIKEQPRTRISQIWVYYGVIDPTEDLDESTNYHGLYVLVDADAESADQYGQPNIEKIYGRWISQFNRPAAESLAQRRLSRYRDPPRHISFDLTFNSKKIDIGQIFWANTRLIQSVSGENDPGRYLAVSYEQSESKINVSGEEFNYQPLDDGGVKRVIVDNNTLNLNLRSAFDDIYSSVSSGDEIELTIESGAFVGSASSSSPALDIGDWPDDVIITVIVNGRIQGKGGDGGRGSGQQASPPEAGEAGGDALYTRYPITLDNQSEIYGGGGGGDGGGDINVRGAGGGGGAGFNVGIGGTVPPNTTGQPTSHHPGPGQNGTINSGGNAGTPSALTASTAGDGGDPGQPGESGPAGNAINGLTFVTFTTAGDIRGPQVN